MRLESVVEFNPDRFISSDYSNSQKFPKATQKLMNPNLPFTQYEKINKHRITSRDIYTAKPGDIIICLMNTKSRLIGIVDNFCIVPNTFCVLRPVSISTNALYVLLKILFVQQQLINNKNSITIKDVKEVMLPYELSPPHNAVLSSLSHLTFGNFSQ